MSKKKQRRASRRATPRQVGRHESGENRAAEAVTTAWVLTMMTTLAAELVGVVAWALQPEAAETRWPVALVALPGLMWFIALVTGLLFLTLTLPVYRLRWRRPPPSFTALGIVASALPLLLWAL